MSGRVRDAAAILWCSVSGGAVGGAAIRWCRVAKPPVTGRHPLRGANLWGGHSGGVARAELNRRLQAFIPAG
jgi:hypothetical protein